MVYALDARRRRGAGGRWTALSSIIIKWRYDGDNWHYYGSCFGWSLIEILRFNDEREEIQFEIELEL